MARRSHTQHSFLEGLLGIVRSIPWKLLLLVPLFVLLAVQTFTYGSRVAGKVLPSTTNIFSTILFATPAPSPTPLPVFPASLPQAGSFLYTTQEGDSCDEILTFQTHMARAGEIFSDVNPTTVSALSRALGHDCHALQPGMVLPLSPQYPLVALGGVVLKVTASSPLQQVPTPLITIAHQQDNVDCSDGCVLSVQIAPHTRIHLEVATTLAIHTGNWVWAQAMLPRKRVAGFDGYPYADPNASLNGATMQACDFQVDTIHDDNSPSCSRLMPNTINDDGGAWLFGVTGPAGLGHWRYPLRLPANTRVLIWLTAENGALKYEAGNDRYRYDEAQHIYVKV